MVEASHEEKIQEHRLMLNSEDNKPCDKECTNFKIFFKWSSKKIVVHRLNLVTILEGRKAMRDVSCCIKNLSFLMGTTRNYVH